MNSSFKRHFALWLFLSRHNALWLFKNSHNTQFRVVAVSLMPERVVVFFPLNVRFRSLSVTHAPRLTHRPAGDRA